MSSLYNYRTRKVLNCVSVRDTSTQTKLFTLTSPSPALCFPSACKSRAESSTPTEGGGGAGASIVEGVKISRDGKLVRLNREHVLVCA